MKNLSFIYINFKLKSNIKSIVKMSSLKRKNNKKPKKKSKVALPKERRSTLLHMLDMDESFSQSDEAIVVVQTSVAAATPTLRLPSDLERKPVSTPTAKDEFQCSKATLMEYESLAASALEGVLRPNQPNINIRDITNDDLETDDVCWESKLNIAQRYKD
jgi:hypothetical protein